MLKTYITLLYVAVSYCTLQYVAPPTYLASSMSFVNPVMGCLATMRGVQLIAFASGLSSVAAAAERCNPSINHCCLLTGAGCHV